VATAAHVVFLRVTVKALFFFEAPPRHFEAQPHYFLMKTLKRKGAGHVARCCGSREHLWAAGRKIIAINAAARMLRLKLAIDSVIIRD